MPPNEVAQLKLILFTYTDIRLSLIHSSGRAGNGPRGKWQVACGMLLSGKGLAALPVVVSGSFLLA